MNDYKQPLLNYLSSLFGLSQDNISFIKNDFNSYIDEVDGHLPHIAFSMHMCEPSDNQEVADLREEILADLSYMVTMYTYNVDDIINFETVLESTVRNGVDLAAYCNDECMKKARLYIHPDIKFRRSELDNGAFKSRIRISCQNVTFSKDIENPIRVNLDKRTQLRVMENLFLLNRLFNKYGEAIDKIKSDSGLKSLTDEEALLQADVGAKQLLETKLTTKSQIERQIAEIYNFGDILETSLVLRENDYIKCYVMMVKRDIDLLEAARQLGLEKEQEQEEQKEAEEKDEKTRKIYSQIGDPEINRYTDRIVEKVRADFNSEISVFGGSTLSEFLLLDYEKKLPCPCVLIRDDANFTLEHRYYCMKKADNTDIVRPYSDKDLPINYGIYLFAYDTDETRLKEVNQRLASLYGHGVNLDIPSSRFENETYSLSLSMKEEQISYKRIERNDLPALFYYSLPFPRVPAVYHLHNISSTEIKSNQRLQLRMLQRAEFCLLCDQKIRNDALSKLESSYAPMFRPAPSRGLLGSAFHALGSIIQTPEYKEVKYCIENRRPVNRGTFDKAFPKIVEVYPTLYEKMMRGYTPEQIKQELEQLRDSYNNEWNSTLKQLCDSQCKGVFKTLDTNFENEAPSGRIRNALIYYINYMVGSFSFLLDDANEAYKKYLEEEAEKARIAEEERREREAQRAEERYYNNKSSNGSNSPGILKMAAGVALGNKLSQPKERKDGKKDLYGTSVCQRCKKKPNGIGGTYTPTSCIGCPASLGCTQKVPKSY